MLNHNIDFFKQHGDQVYSVIGGASSDQAKLLIPFMLKQNTKLKYNKLFISPTASDPQLSISMYKKNKVDYFLHKDNHFMRMHGSDEIQCAAITKTISQLNFHRVIIISSSSSYGKHGTFSCKYQLNKQGIKIEKIHFVHPAGEIDFGNNIYEYIMMSGIFDEEDQVDSPNDSDNQRLTIEHPKKSDFKEIVTSLKEAAAHTVIMH